MINQDRCIIEAYTATGQAMRPLKYKGGGKCGGLIIIALDSGSSGPGLWPGVHCSKVPVTFRACKSVLCLLSLHSRWTVY